MYVCVRGYKSGGGRPESALSREMLASQQLLLLMGWVITESCVSFCAFAPKAHLSSSKSLPDSSSHPLPLRSPSSLRTRDLQEPYPTVRVSQAGQANRPGVDLRLRALGFYQSELPGPSPNWQGP